MSNKTSNAQNTDHLPAEAMKFLYEMEILDDPQLLNNLELNILTTSKRILDVEILSLHNYGRKEMLVYLNLSWWGRKFQQDEISAKVCTMVKSLLPNFQLRVTCDVNILDAAVQNVTNFFGGEKKLDKPVKV